MGVGYREKSLSAKISHLSVLQEWAFLLQIKYIYVTSSKVPQPCQEMGLDKQHSLEGLHIF